MAILRSCFYLVRVSTQDLHLGLSIIRFSSHSPVLHLNLLCPLKGIYSVIIVGVILTAVIYTFENSNSDVNPDPNVQSSLAYFSTCHLKYPYVSTREVQGIAGNIALEDAHPSCDFFVLILDSFLSLGRQSPLEYLPFDGIGLLVNFHCASYWIGS